MLKHRKHGLPYLLKQRHSPKVNELVQRMMRQEVLWQNCGDGWEALETSLRRPVERRTNNHQSQHPTRER